MVAPIILSPWERAELERIAHSDLPNSVVLRAKAILLASEGMPGIEIARHTGYSNAAVSRLKTKFRIVRISNLFYRAYGKNSGPGPKKSRPRPSNPNPRPEPDWYPNMSVIVDQPTHDGLRAMAKAHGMTIKELSGKMVRLGVKHYYESLQG